MADCMICLQHLRPPVRVLPCCHSFCLECLRHLRNRCGVYNFDDGTISVTCPNCREKVRLDKGKVSTLPTNFALNKLLEAGAVASVTTVTDDNSRTGQCAQQSVPFVNAEPDETSSAFYARFRGGQFRHEITQRDHESFSAEAQSEVGGSTTTSLAHENIIARLIENLESLEEEEHQPGYWDVRVSTYLQPSEAAASPTDSVYIDGNLQFETSVQNQQIHPAVSNEPHDIYSVLTFAPSLDEISHTYYQYFPPQPTPLSGTSRTTEIDRSARPFRSFSEKIRNLSVAIHCLRLRIDEIYDNVMARLDEVDRVTDVVTTSEADENFDETMTASKFDISSASYNEINFETAHDSTITTLECVTSEFTELAADHDSITRTSAIWHENHKLNDLKD